MDSRKYGMLEDQIEQDRIEREEFEAMFDEDDGGEDDEILVPLS